MSFKESFFRHLRFKAHFHNDDTQEPPPITQTTSFDAGLETAVLIGNRFPKTSSWPLQHKALDLYIDICRYEISNVNY